MPTAQINRPDATAVVRQPLLVTLHARTGTINPPILIPHIMIPIARARFFANQLVTVAVEGRNPDREDPIPSRKKAKKNPMVE